MRSHVIYPIDQEKLQKRTPSVKMGGNNISVDSDAAGYTLRENPKKTCRFDDASEDTLLHVDKLCKECGKAFQSWKALFGHMKCHSDKIAHTFVDEQDSWTSADQSDNGKANPKRKRSLRTKRYYKMEVSGTTSTSLSYNANGSSSVSEIEQKLEEVALCLIMLSKDVTQWSGLKSAGESVNNSEFIDAQSFIKPQFKELVSDGGDTNFEKRKKETLRDGPKMSRSEIRAGGLMLSHKLKKSNVVEELEFQVSEVEMEATWINGSKCKEKADLGSKKISSSKRKVFDSVESEIKQKNATMVEEGCVESSRYECASCNKAFNTFQALGGHRASHKKMKGCFGLRKDVCENSIVGADHGISINRFAEKSSPIAHKLDADSSNRAKKTNKGGSHECQICFRVFTSGQALGGHKRSHLVADAKNNQNVPSNSTVTQKPIQEIRNFLDLNLPAPDEDSTSTSGLGFDPWFLGTNKNNGPLLGLLI